MSITPSAVSQQLAILEREAGVQLLEKSGRRVRLTDAAVLLVRHADRRRAAQTCRDERAVSRLSRSGAAVGANCLGMSGERALRDECS